MHVFKKKYFLIIENTKDIDLRNIKKRDKFVIIYRNIVSEDNILNLKRFRTLCKSKNILFFVANDIDLAISLHSDGLYLSAKNINFRSLSQRTNKFRIIGSAHNFREIDIKKRQGCDLILLSRLFKVSYKQNQSFLGIIKFNNYSLKYNNLLIPLGGIDSSNISKLKSVQSNFLALMSEVKKKPAKIFSRLF